jgi:hypothetical protein
MCHKVKGIAMCNFNDKEIEILTKNGNEVSLHSAVSRDIWDPNNRRKLEIHIED